MQLWFLSVLAMFKCIQTNSVSFKFIILSRFQIYIRRNVNIYDYMNISEFKSCDHHEIMRRLSSIFNSQKIGFMGLNVNQSRTILVIFNLETSLLTWKHIRTQKKLQVNINVSKLIIFPRYVSKLTITTISPIQINFLFTWLK